MSILNSIDREIDLKAKEEEINKKLEIYIDVKLREMESGASIYLRKFLQVKTSKYDNKQSSKNLIDVPNKIEYLDKRLTAVEIGINRIFNNFSFISDKNATKIKKYEDLLKMEARIKDLKRRMKITLLRIYELDDYYAEYIYDPHE